MTSITKKTLRASLPLAMLLTFGLSNAQRLPDRMSFDTAHGPFLWGVASGDPDTSAVLLWTKVDARDGQHTLRLSWQVSTDSLFLEPEAQGQADALPDNGHCVTVEAGGLRPGRQYFYRFIDPEGRISATGIARTLPTGRVERACLAVVSCSSVWAGYFHAYGIISRRKEIDFVVHLGDYVYDYPDRRQLRRMPDFPQEDVQDLEGWRERHAYYLLDEDLREARRTKTWMVVWDNHDIDLPDKSRRHEAIKAFYEFVPIRPEDTERPDRIYRSFRIGDLADLHMIDMFLFRGKEEFAPGMKSVLGNHQDAWLKSRLAASRATWQLIGNQEMMSDWLSEDAPGFLRNSRGDGRVFDPGNWSGMPHDRQRLFDHIRDSTNRNVMVLTGDVHMTFAMNLTGSPKCPERYDRKTGQGSVGTEIAGPSISRVNMKAYVPGVIIPLIRDMSLAINPHHIWAEFMRHGYFTVDLTPDSIVAEVWHVPIRQRRPRQRLMRGFTMLEGKGRWERRPSRRPVAH